MMRKTLLWIGKASIAGLIVIIELSLFTLLYHYTGAHSDSPTGATDFVFQPHQLYSTMEEGFAWTRMDEDGFNNPDGSKNLKIDNLLVGSSHMYAYNVPAKLSTAYLLNDLLPEMHTYNIAMGEHLFSTCISNLENAVNIYHPSSYVIVQTSDVALNMQEMEEVCNGTYEELSSYNDGPLYWFQRFVPAAKIIYKQLSDWILLSSPSKAEENSIDFLSKDYSSLINKYLFNAANTVEKSGAKLIIFYIPDLTILKDGSLEFQTDENAVAAFNKSCVNNEILFIDMTAEFQKMYIEKHKLPYGFINSRVGHGHLNVNGHRVVAEKLQEVIVNDVNSVSSGVN